MNNDKNCGLEERPTNALAGLGGLVGAEPVPPMMSNPTVPLERKRSLAPAPLPLVSTAGSSSKFLSPTSSTNNSPAGTTSTEFFGIDETNLDLGGDDSEDDMAGRQTERRAGRRKIKIEYIDDKSRRHITFSKRKAGIMKKAYELSTLTGTQVLLLVASETGHVYTFATPKLQPLITKPEGKNLIQACLNAPEPGEGTNPTASGSVNVSASYGAGTSDGYHHSHLHAHLHPAYANDPYGDLGSSSHAPSYVPSPFPGGTSGTASAPSSSYYAPGYWPQTSTSGVNNNNNSSNNNSSPNIPQ